MTTKVTKQKGILQKLRQVWITVSRPVLSGTAVLAFAAIGTILLIGSKAATPTASYEAEAGTRSGNASVVSDSTASGTSAVKFSAASSGSCPTATANVPDGTDPWSGCWPGPASTGYPHGLAGDTRTPVTLTNYTGPTTITTAGTVIQNVKITQCITLNASANNVTFRNVLFQGSGCYWLVLNDSGAQNLQIIDSEFDGLGGTSGDASIAGYNYTLTRVNIHGTVDGLKLGNNVTIQDSYIHDLAIDPTVGADGTHNDGMQSLGSDDVVVQHNTIIIKDGGTSAIILSTGSADSIHRVNITKNLMAGGAYTVYGGYLAGTDDASKVGSISITNNRFSTVTFPKSGAFGPMTSVDAPAVTHTGNLWADGSKAGQSAD